MRNYTGNAIRLIDDGTFNLNGYTANPRAGYVGIGDASIMATPGGSLPSLPWARLHLVHTSNAVSDFGYRPWMQNGMLITGNSDQMYVGHKYGSNDASDAVIQWSEDGTLGSTRQQMRFLFTTTPASGSGAVTSEGLELMRLYPQSSTVGYVGVGDFYGLGYTPSAALDVAAGNVRVRALPGTSATTDSKVVVSDTAGVLHWRPITDFTSCDWEVSSSNGYAAWRANGTTPGCPESDNQMYIGHNPANTVTNPAKLNVLADSGAVNYRYGINSEAVAGASGIQAIGVQTSATPNASNARANDHTGLKSEVSNAEVNNRAIHATANVTAGNNLSNLNCGIQVGAYAEDNLGDTVGNTFGGNYAIKAEAKVESTAEVHLNYGLHSEVSFEYNPAEAHRRYGFGVYGRANSDWRADRLHGVVGVAVAPTDQLNEFTVGVMGSAYGLDNDYDSIVNYGHSVWAGYFYGHANITGTLVYGNLHQYSDETIKTNITEIPPDMVSNILGQVQPKMYEYNHEAVPQLRLPGGSHFGFIAQQVEQVVPSLVATERVAAATDANGFVTGEDVPLKAMNYTEFIPLLIKGYQQQQERLEQLEQALSACCGTGKEQTPNSRSLGPGTSDLSNERLLIAPNPFTDHTIVSYYMAQPGRVSLQVSDEASRPIALLRQEQAMAGSFTYEWNTQSLAPGSYFVALVVDGNVVVKKAVKVQ